MLADVVVFSVIVALGVYGDTIGTSHLPAFPTTAYIIGALCGVVAAILVLMGGCKG